MFCNDTRHFHLPSYFGADGVAVGLNLLDLARHLDVEAVQ